VLKVVVVDDHAAFADALALAVEADVSLTCTGTANSVDQALELCDRTLPDVVLMDVQLPGTDGLTGVALLRARHPAVTMLLLTGQQPSGALLGSALEAGADGLLSKTASLASTLDAIRMRPTDTFVVDRTFLTAALRNPKPAEAEDRLGPGGDGPSGLTVREQEILELLASGVDAQSAATRLGISVHTCRGHVKSLLLKLGAHSQLEAVATARERGLLDAPSPQATDPA
jgi:DNA-binding NarL/FixJ family response regulator